MNEAATRQLGHTTLVPYAGRSKHMSQQNSSRLYFSCKNGCDLIRYPYQHLFAATRRTCTAQHVYELLKDALFNCERSFCRKWRAGCLNHWRRLGWHRALAAVLPVCSSPAQRGRALSAPRPRPAARGNPSARPPTPAMSRKKRCVRLQGLWVSPGRSKICKIMNLQSQLGAAGPGTKSL
jgi:hypothetical protein